MRTVYVAAVFAAAIGLANAARAQPAAPHPGMTMPAHRAGPDAPAAGMDTMTRDMAAVPVTGDPDRDFAAMMVPHHQGAIDMARQELAHGRDPALRKMARTIIAAQNTEIAALQAWLAKHPAP